MLAPIRVFQPGKDCTTEASRVLELLSKDDLNRKVSVISIAGRYRQGKSFLMNFIIRYLRAKGASRWLEDGAGETLTGFDWEHSRNRVTFGVLIWPEIFKITSASGEEINVILMDTQGIFDTQTTVGGCASVFSLSVLLSSIQIFNVKQNIQGDDLSSLELFVEFGRLVHSQNPENHSRSEPKPFQELVFLVRDWTYPDEMPFGWDGGQTLLNEKLGITGLEGELETMRTNIKNSFESTKCFLMSHPGMKVDTSADFKGKLSDIEPGFVGLMKSFIEDIFRPSNIKPKTVHGKELTVRDFLVHMELYVRALSSDEMPSPKRLYEATVDATNSAAVNSAVGMYQSRVSALVMEDPRDPAEFEEFHNDVSNEVLTNFNEVLKMGGEVAISTALRELESRIGASKHHFELANTAAWDAKRFEGQVEALRGHTDHLEDQIRNLDHETLELRTELKKAEEDKERLEKDAQKMQALDDMQKNLMSQIDDIRVSNSNLQQQLIDARSERAEIEAKAERSRREMEQRLADAERPTFLSRMIGVGAIVVSAAVSLLGQVKSRQN